MALRFSNNGPEFPSKFVDSLLSGETIFLTGTGVSAPQMPEFQSLVERTYENLAVDKTDSEQTAFDAGRFEEVLGSLRRRLSDPNAVTRTVSELLTVPNNPNLYQHHTILRLSRDLDNHISVVTTNFDTLLERAAAEVMGDEAPRDLSFAGQALPTPGSPFFSGIIHIHGRLADNVHNLELTPLVLTSADYGDAYMRSGWASRFLFDLARCKAIVLVGYSANDAPVRYFLNVLEADRARFPDLKPVYAFHAYESDPEEAIRSWGTLAVVPLPYSKTNPETGQPDHSPLWRDLAQLAEVVEHPKRSMQERAQAILAEPAAKVAANSQRELDWLFRRRGDLWATALKVIKDPRWFDFLHEIQVLSIEDAPGVIAAWVSQDFQDYDRFECARVWQRRLNRPFTDQIAQRLLQAQGLGKTWTRIWRLFCLVEPAPDNYSAYYATKRRLTSDVVLDSDLRAAVGLLAPRLVLCQFHHELPEKNRSQPINQLSDVAWPRMSISNTHYAEELVDTLSAMSDRAKTILEIATAELRSSLRLQADLQLIGEEHDVNDGTVPSIEHHSQNQHHEGVIFLVRVLVESLCQTAIFDRTYAKRVAIGWKDLPGRIGLRLCFHAMRNSQLFDSDEAMSGLLSASDIEFWEIRREIALLVKDRAGTASAMLVSRVEDRICQTSDAYFDRYPIEPGETDWRSHARDSAVWLRLIMLQDAGVLSKTGGVELSAIKERREYLNRAVEDQDFFDSYSYGVRQIVGNPEPIAEAGEDDRLRVARELTHSPDFDLQQGWSAYCRSDPEGAFDSLCKGDPSPENGVLWNNFLLGLALVDAKNKAVRDKLAMRAFDHLESVSSDALKPMVSGLAYLMYSMRRQEIVNLENWLDRLWQAISDKPEEALDLTTDLYDQAINSNVGKLTETLLFGLQNKRKECTASRERLLTLALRICGYDDSIGQLARAILTVNVAFLLAIDRQCVVDTLAPRISARDPEGAALRAVMLKHGSITPSISHVLGEAICEGVVESQEEDGHGAAVVASKIIRQAMAEVRSGNQDLWGLNTSQVADVLRQASQAIRCGALDVLAAWLTADESGAEKAWKTTFGPFFDRVWPKELEFRDVSLAPRFVEIAVKAGNAFPEAFEQLRPYIVPYNRMHNDLYPIKSSEIPKKFPHATLSLLWLICGPGSQGEFYEIPDIIDLLIETDPEIEVDRRLQWLEANTKRFD